MTNLYFLNKQITARLLAAVTIVSLLLSALPVAFFVALADSVGSISFESGYTTGSINAQDGWNSTGPFDQGVADVSALALTELGSKAFRISNAVTSGSFGDQTFVKSLTDSVGEVDSTNGTFSPGSKKNTFEMEFDFTSASPSAQQPGLFISTAPDRGDGSRMSYLSFEDVAGGIKVNFADVQGAAPGTFVTTTIGTYDRDEVNTIKLVMTVVDGPSNDIVKVYVNNALVHTGTSWENYYRFNPESVAEQSPRIVKTVLFRSAGTAVPANDDKGFLFDNISLKSSNVMDVPKTTSTVVVTSANLQGFSVEASGGGQTTFIPNASAPLGIGNLNLVSNSSNDARAGVRKTVDVPLSSLDGLSYKTRQNDSIPEGNAAYRIGFDADGNPATTNDVATLIYEPYWQNAMSPDPAPVVPDVWQTWNVDNGHFWVSVPGASAAFFTPNGILNGAGGPPFFTLAQIEAFYPNAKVTSFGVHIGSYNPSYNIDVDSVVFGTNTEETRYDFEPLPSCELVIKSDTVDFVEEKNALAKLLSFVHGNWLQEIPGSAAKWIWGDNPVVNPTVEETQTFVKKFNWTGGTPTSATLKVASDNGHAVTLGSFTGGNTVGNTFAATADYNVASAVLAGENTLEIAVTNLATPNDSNPQNNPAGLMYELVIKGVGESCGSVTPITPVVNATLAITNPVANNDVVSGLYDFTAQYVDNDATVDNIQWAIRTGASCNANTGTVAGNVDGFSNPSSFTGTNFLASVDTSSFAPGQYCFVVNPQEQTGETDLRATRLFMITPPPTSDVTLCKYDNSEVPKALAGWQLSLLGALVDTITVPTNTMNGANSVALDEDGSYVAVAEGTWTNTGQSGNTVDAEYSLTSGGWVDGFPGYGANILELQINSEFDPASNWGPYNSLHRYAQGFSPENDGPANFRIFDGNGETPEAGWYGDNQGTLGVKVYKGYTGVTGANGCVTFQDVPHGTYQVDEIMKDGWVNVSGLTQSAVVDGETETFSVVNRDTSIPLTCKLEINSSEETVIVDTNDYAEATYDNHPSWTGAIPDAIWVWISEFVDEFDNPQAETTYTFKETFTVTNPTEATLVINADNWYKIIVNGEEVIDRTDQNNYQSFQQLTDTTAVLSELVSGENTIEFVVTNEAMNGGTKLTNPAGLLFKLSVTAAAGEGSCVVTTEPEPEVPELCPEGYTGTYPECVPPPCPEGQVGTFPSCTTPDPETPVECPDGFERLSEGAECTEVPPTVTPQPESRSSSSGGTRTGSRNAPGGQVLGASTMQCGMLLDTYMKMGQDNNPEEVKELQWFLIGQGYVLVATGVFDAQTDAAVRAFQEANRAEILTPWVTAGILQISNPTGWVYQLTRWKINNIVCPGSEAAPILIP